jgi:hypothetical protein
LKYFDPSEKIFIESERTTRNITQDLEKYDVIFGKDSIVYKALMILTTKYNAYKDSTGVIQGFSSKEPGTYRRNDIIKIGN